MLVGAANARDAEATPTPAPAEADETSTACVNCERALATSCHTAPWSSFWRAANFSDFVATASVEELKRSARSEPRRVHRPCSTQNDAIGTRPDLEGNRKSSGNTRSCWPPFTMSPD